LIDPACCYRTAPCPAGRRDDRQPDPNPALPQRICTITALEKAHNQHNPQQLIFPASAEVLHRPGPASRPFVLATLRALRR